MEWSGGWKGSIVRVQDELSAQMQQFMVMFARQNPVKLSPDFPLREHTEPILQRNEANGERDTSKIGADPEEELTGLRDRARDRPVNPHTGFPMPRMDIPTFEGINPRWWLCLVSRKSSAGSDLRLGGIL